MPYVRRTIIRRRFRSRASRPYGRRIRFSRRFRRTWRRRGHLRTSRIKVRPPLSTDEAFVKFKWNYVQEVSSASGLAYDLIIRANSIYDPNYATGGSTAQGYAQWSPMYQQYQVTACKITVNYFNGDSVEPQILTIIADPGNSANLPSTSYAAYGTSDLQYVLGSRSRIATTDQSRQSTTVKYYMTTAKIMGKKLDQLDDSISPIASNPVRAWFWHVLVKKMTSNTSASGYVNVKVTYYTVLSKRTVALLP